MPVYIANCESPLGMITLAGEGRALSGLWFEGQKHYGSTFTGREVPGEAECFDAVRAWLDEYFSGRVPERPTMFELAPIGTEFCIQIWHLLCEVDYGKTITYGELARIYELRAGRHVGARAVGMAVGRNPISIIIPCHRVLGAGGALTGYAGGLERKRCLLALERSTE